MSLTKHKKKTKNTKQNKKLSSERLHQQKQKRKHDNLNAFSETLELEKTRKRSSERL